MKNADNRNVYVIADRMSESERRFSDRNFIPKCEAK